MFGQNKFLSDFMRQQSALIESGIPSSSGRERTAKQARKPKLGRAEGDPPFNEKDAFAILVSEKPAKKDVIEYFKKRVEQLVTADLS